MNGLNWMLFLTLTETADIWKSIYRTKEMDRQRPIA